MTKRHKKDLRKVDQESTEYWNELLRRDGLTMSAGLSPRIKYSGSDLDLTKIEARNAADLSCGDGRRVHPTGAKPD